MSIKAIETSYKGYRFRSRLEARWAVFFDALGVPWEYEPEGFHLASGMYLPDFFLPFPGRESYEQGWRGVPAYWLEVKPGEPNERERRLMLELAASTRHHVYCFAGDCGAESLRVYTASVQGRWHDQTYQQHDFEHELTEIRRSVGAPPLPVDPLTIVAFTLYGFACNLRSCDRNNLDEGIYAAAFRAARSARFEHGETPHLPRCATPPKTCDLGRDCPGAGCGNTGVLFLDDPGRDPEWCPCDLSGHFGTGMNSEVLDEWLKRIGRS